MINLLRAPDQAAVRVDGKIQAVQSCGNDCWESCGVRVETVLENGCLAVQVSAQNTRPETIILHWKGCMEPGSLYLNDHWERGYGDLAWQPLNPERVFPWYFMQHTGKLTHGYGVMTGASSMAFWQVTEKGLYLWLDVRCGGTGVQLNGRVLTAAKVVCRQGLEGESAYKATAEFCKMMCPNPRLPAQRIYGGNNWYTDYGNTSREGVLNQADMISQLAGNQTERPFMLVDDGWQVCHFEACAGGPWTCGNYLFPHFEQLAHQLKEKGTRPGLWFRPLMTAEQMPEECLLPEKRFATSEMANSFRTRYLDPSAPAVLEKVEKDMTRFREWGFEMVKHDFSTFDIFGRWGFQMGGFLTNSGWSFYDRTKTTAEIICEFYRTLRRGAKDDVYILGCNTVSHLSAGIFELNRTGDDTSGREWERTRKMGVNTLAFRGPQHNAFYAADPDCIGLTKDVPWKLNAQFMELVAKSGMPLFLSIELGSFGDEQAKVVSELFSAAQKPAEICEPLDWMDSPFPARWNINGEERIFDWYDQPVPVNLLSQVFGE